MKSTDLTIKLFADGADLQSIIKLNQNPLIKGFTTNPTLMKKAGIQNYRSFAKEVLLHVKDKPISFEVFADDFDDMYAQAQDIASWGDNVYVKIPITNTLGQSSITLIEKLSTSKVKVNVTGVFTLEQVADAGDVLSGGAPSVISVFAGRIADTGENPTPIMLAAKKVCLLCSHIGQIELLWASPRELYNIVEADNAKCDIITVSHDLLSKLNLLGKDLTEFSLETVKMFYNDAKSAGYSL